MSSIFLDNRLDVNQSIKVYFRQQDPYNRQRREDRRNRQGKNICTQEHKQGSLALASMGRDDSPASSTASSTAPLSTAPASSTAAAMRGKVGSEFET